jgi:rubrerythrin
MEFDEILDPQTPVVQAPDGSESPEVPVLSESLEASIVPEVQMPPKKTDVKKRKKLCKLVKKDFQKKHLKEYLDLVQDPVWVCKKCGRASNDVHCLCKPVKIKGNDSTTE